MKFEAVVRTEPGARAAAYVTPLVNSQLVIYGGEAAAGRRTRSALKWSTKRISLNSTKQSPTDLFGAEVMVSRKTFNANARFKLELIWTDRI